MSDRTWPPTSRETPEHHEDCLALAYGPGSGYCDLGCDSFIERHEAYWEGYDIGREEWA